jgi:hypothetical protein
MKTLLAVTLVFSSYAANAATTSDNTDDASALGTSSSPQVERQSSRTDKGATGINQGSTESDASNLGNAETPQIKRQMERANKELSEPVAPNRKNKVLKNMDDNHGTTKGNKVQPAEPTQAPPTTSNY